MISVNVRYNKFGSIYHHQKGSYKAFLVTVQQSPDGTWLAVIYTDDALRVVPATDLEEWEG